MALRFRLTHALTRSLRNYAGIQPATRMARPAAYTRLLLYASSATATATATTLSMPARAFAEATTTKVPPVMPSRAAAMPEVKLYQYEVCPFCNKVRAYLDYHNVPYSVIEVDPLRKKELEFSEYRKVPIAVVNGEQVNGSGAVIARVKTALGGGNATDEEARWLTWLDDKLIHLIAPNIYRTAGESLQTFEYIADNAKFSAWQRSTIRYTGAAAMYFVGRKMKKKYDIKDEREEIHAALRDWTDAIATKGSKFLAGDQPGLADLSIFGVLRAIETFDTFREMRERNNELVEWYDRTKEAIGETCVVARE